MLFKQQTKRLAFGVLFVLHTAIFVLFAFGWIIGLFYPQWLPYQLIYILIIMSTWRIYGSCPLTDIQKKVDGGQNPILANEGFVSYLILKITGAHIPPATVNGAAFWILILTGTIYLTMLILG